MDYQPGDILPDHTIKDINNNPIALFDSTKTNLIVFWASWCQPCWKEMPTLREIYKEFGSNENFRMVSVSIDEDGKDWRDGLVKAELPWEQAIALGEEDMLKAKYNFIGIPYIIIADKERKLIKGILGFREGYGDTVRVDLLRI